jgi:dTDP-glucose pyrophosphorylase
MKASEIHLSQGISLSPWAMTGSNWAAIGLPSISIGLRLSARGELEDHRHPLRYWSWENFIRQARTRGYAWLRTGPHDTLLESSELVRPISTGRAPGRLPG